MITTRATFPLGKYVTMEVKDFENQHIEVIFVQTVYEQNLLKKKEFSLTLRRFQQVLRSLEDIKQAVKDHQDGKEVHYMKHLGANRYVQVNTGFRVVDLREFWLPEGKNTVQPTRRGIALKFEEFETLIQLDFERILPELKTTTPCMFSEDHQNQLGYLMCAECNPDDYMNW